MTSRSDSGSKKLEDQLIEIKEVEKREVHISEEQKRKAEEARFESLLKGAESWKTTNSPLTDAASSTRA